MRIKEPQSKAFRIPTPGEIRDIQFFKSNVGTEEFKLIEQLIAELSARCLGTIIATGIIDDTISMDSFMNPVLVEPPCNFCKLGHFCGKTELA